jgi:hypothetical protein
MCGPLLLACQGVGGRAQAGQSYKGQLYLGVTYNVSRILSYTLIGALFGYAGSKLGNIELIGEYISFVGGIILVLAGILLLDIIPAGKIISGTLLTRISSRPLRFLKNRSINPALVSGLLTPLLPCGVLYAMFLQSAMEKNALKGAMTMAIFGLGVSPSLLLLGIFAPLFSIKFRKKAEKIAAVLVILLGVILIMRGLHIPYLSWLSGSSVTGSKRCH